MTTMQAGKVISGDFLHIDGYKNGAHTYKPISLYWADFSAYRRLSYDDPVYSFLPPQNGKHGNSIHLFSYRALCYDHLETGLL